MRFLVDADACPVTAEVEKLAKKRGVLVYCFMITIIRSSLITVKYGSSMPEKML